MTLSLKLPAPRAVLFDWDNTLVDTWPMIHEALERTFADMGAPAWTLEETKAKVRRSMRDAFPDIFGPRWQQASDAYQQHYRALHLERLKPLPGAEEVLRQVKEAGLFSAVVSNKKNVNLVKELAKLGWEKYFDRWVGADDAKRDKPHPDPVHLALEESEIIPDAEVWFVGDSGIDLECAFACGLTPILYGPVTPAEEGKHEGFHFRAHVKDHVELQELLRRGLSA